MDLFSALLGMGNISPFSLYSLDDIRKFYDKWKIVHEVVGEHPEIFQNIDKLSAEETRIRLMYLEDKREEVKIRELRSQMQLMIVILNNIETWVSSNQNSIFDTNLEVGTKLDFVRRVCKLYNFDQKIVQTNVYRAIEYTNYLIAELKREADRVREAEKQRKEEKKRKTEGENVEEEKIVIEDSE